MSDRRALETTALALLDGLLSACAGLLAAGTGAWRAAERADLVPGWAPTFGWLATSCGFALGLALATWRLARPDAPARSLGRSAGCVLLTCAIAASLTSAAGLSEVLQDFTLFAGAPVFLWLAGAWTFVGPREGRGLRGLAAASTVVALVAMPFTAWPLRLLLPVSRPALESLADRAEAGLPLDLPAQAGLLRVVRVERVSGVLLVTSPDPSGSVGLARCECAPGAEPWGSVGVGSGWELVQQD